jgi:TonB-dependent SusC/RagA subfamily outer membrane receptor
MMKLIVGFALLLLLNHTLSAQQTSRTGELMSLLNQYFGSSTSSGTKAKLAQRTFYIKSDSLFICFFDPEDIFTKGEYRDTNAIPLGQLEKVILVTGRSADGAAGAGIQFIPRFTEPSIPKPISENNGAVGEVSGQSLSQVAAGTLNQKMTGQVAGVTVGNDNSPGGAAMVRIRGFGSINSNSPLYVVDGVPITNINTINPNDIESVNVLKDPSTTAIYGVRGANGVVLIKTKTGGATTFVIPNEILNQKPLPYTLWVYGKKAKEFKKEGIGEKIQELLVK